MNRIDTSLSVGGIPVGFVYLLKTGGRFKIGQSVDVDGVLHQARRFDAGTRLLSCWATADHKDAEKLIHDGLKCYRLELEQFEIPADAVQWICSLDDREFLAWVNETGCDRRAIGWTFPRIFNREGLRMWSCVYFPEVDLVAWAAVFSESKPEYSRLEQMHLQRNRAFNSTWFGRPMKFGAKTEQPAGC